jgi:hypothetical protein
MSGEEDGPTSSIGSEGAINQRDSPLKIQWGGVASLDCSEDIRI